MQNDDEVMQWLREQPLDEPVEIDGESVYLRVHSAGAELGAHLVRAFSPAQLQDALRQGFQSALAFDAGLGCSDDGTILVLNQWLPHVRNWADAAEALEKLLDQVSMWRAGLFPTKPQQMDKLANRNEQRLRSLFTGANQ
jgi:hypothetical protein